MVKKPDFVKEKISYRIYKEQDREGVLKLLKHLWGESDENNKDYFKWKYETHRSRHTRFIAEYGGKIIGFRGFFPYTFCYKQKRFNAFGASDITVDPNYRRCGVFKSLTEYALLDFYNKKRVDFYANFSSNALSSPGYLKMGWKEVKVEHLNFYLSNKYIHYIKNIKYIGSALSPVLDLIGSKTEFRTSSFELEIKTSLNDAIIEKYILFNKDSGGCYQIKDSAFYKWRFLNPKKKYLFLNLKDGTELLAYAILVKLGSYGYYLVDYDFKTISLFEILLDKMKEAALKGQITVWGRGKKMNALKKIGFKDPNTWLRSKRYGSFLLRPNSPTLTSKSWIMNELKLENNEVWEIKPILEDGS